MTFDANRADDTCSATDENHPAPLDPPIPPGSAGQASDLPTRIDTRTIVTGAIALSVDQASRLSNLSTATIYRALASGHLKRRKYGHRTLIMFADLEAFLEGLAGER